jgi:hypothetical protein
VALEEDDPPVTVVIGCEADLKWQTNVVVDTDLVGIDFASKDPAAQTIAAGLEAGVVCTDLDTAMGRERIDCQLMPDIGVECRKIRSDRPSAIGQRIGFLNFSRLYEVDEIPRHRPRCVGATAELRKTISRAGHRQRDQDQSTTEPLDVSLQQPSFPQQNPRDCLSAALQ